MKPTLSFFAALLSAGGFALISSSVFGAEAVDGRPETTKDPKQVIAALSAQQYDNAADRERAIVSAALADLEAVKRETGHVVFDFVAQRAKAQQENVQSVELRRIGPPDEVPEEALQEHPKPKGRALLTYRVAIPAADAKRCLLTFDALLNNAKSNGAAFAIEIDGREVFARQLKGAERVPAEIDLADFRGREVSIAFIVDPLADPAGDWATWVAPRVVLR